MVRNRVAVPDVVAALDARLRTIVVEIGIECDDAATPMSRLHCLASHVRESRSRSELWLLAAAVCGELPTSDLLRTLERALALASEGNAHLAVLEACGGPASVCETVGQRFDVVGGIVIDVDFSARHGHSTGIQRVTRETVKRWRRDHDVRLVAWTIDGEIMRELRDDELGRVVEWTSANRSDRPAADALEAGPFVVPWAATVIVPEVGEPRLLERLACMAEWSGNRVIIIGHDMIPISTPADVLASETNRFVQYLSVVKHASLIVTVSEATATEFESYFTALEPQGLRRPPIIPVPLPVEAPPVRPTASSRAPDGPPLVLCVGSLEPRKNQSAILAAAQILWRDGDRFRLRFIGGTAGQLSGEFFDEVARAERAGRPVEVYTSAGDDLLAESYDEARFTVFVSRAEGFGLPVGESLAMGRPVITSDHGSMAEIARGGGCIVVPARDDAAIAKAMRRLLFDDELHARLVAEARSRPSRTWDDYAEELWAVSVGYEAS